jgi:predicted transcriptional regulator
MLVYFEILTELAKGSIGPTKLARRVNLSYDRLPPYLDNLVSKGAARKEVREGREEYSITQVGMQLLGDLERVRKVISD